MVKKLLGILLFCLMVHESRAQFQPLQHPKNAAQRQQWDAERVGLSFDDKQALDFAYNIRLGDASYYLANMYEGIYRSEQAADILGFQAAIPYLEKALDELKYDYEIYLSERSSDYYKYFSFYTIQRDYCFLIKYLKDAYAYTNQPHKAYNILRTAVTYGMQYYYVINPYQDMAWIVHRNRTATNQQYDFLKNSIEENEALAIALLDSSLIEAKENVAINANFYSSFYQTVANGSDFNKAIIYSYGLNIDSGTYYYNAGIETGYYSPNNFATYNVVQGKFFEGEMMYDVAEGFDDMEDHSLKEFIYYRSILHIYHHEFENNISTLKDFIKEKLSQPGFGWYNLALARVWSYKGDQDSATYYLEKAQSFKELHIGTTLGESHYQFSTRLLQYIIGKRKLSNIIRADKYWWIKPWKWLSLGKQYVINYTAELELVQEIASNPEMEIVLFRLFSTESTVSWDELSIILSVIRPGKMVDYYKKMTIDDPRPEVIPYMHYMVALMHYRSGESQEALLEIKSLLQQIDFDQNYDRLFIGRIYELYLCIMKDLGDSNQDTYFMAMRSLWQEYPQLLYYQSTFKPVLNITVDSDIKKVWNKLNIVQNAHPLLPKWNIQLLDDMLFLKDIETGTILNKLYVNENVTERDLMHLIFFVNVDNENVENVSIEE